MRIAVASPDRDAWSQTFVRAHVEGLPGVAWHLHGGAPPTLARRPGADLDEPLDGRRRFSTWRRRDPIADFLRDERIDVLLAEFGPTGVAVAEACAAAGVPLVVHFHGYDAYRADALAHAGLRYPALFALAAAVVVVSTPMREQLRALGAPPERLHLLPYGVAPETFVATPLPAAPPEFLAAGRFCEKKAPHLTLLAFREVLREVPEARLRLVGDGPLREACEILVQALGLRGSVTFAGVASHAGMPALFAASRAFVQHSITTPSGDREGLPVAILEAQMCGRPVVSTRHAGIPEAIVEQETGLLVDEGDIATMADAMVRLAREPELASRMGAEAAARARCRFALGPSLERLAALLASCAGRRTSA